MSQGLVSCLRGSYLATLAHNWSLGLTSGLKGPHMAANIHSQGLIIVPKGSYLMSGAYIWSLGLTSGLWGPYLVSGLIAGLWVQSYLREDISCHFGKNVVAGLQI